MADSGWKGQPPWLKLMLPVSLVLMALGVYRCSMELTPEEGPGVIRVEPTDVEIPESLTTMPPDSLSALTTRLFARALRDISETEVSVGDDPLAWAVVRLRLRGLPDGRVELGGVASSTASRRPLAVSTLSDSLYRLRELTARTADFLAAELDVSAPEVSEPDTAEFNTPDHAPEER